MNDPNRQIADAIVAVLNGPRSAEDGPWSVEFEAERIWLPGKKLEDLETVWVPVVPRGTKGVERETRVHDKETLEVEVGIQQRIGSSANEHVDPLADLVQQIDAFLRRQQFPIDGQTAVWRNTDYLVNAYPDHLRQNKFTTAFALTYELIRKY